MRDFELPGRSLAIGREAMAATSQPAATLVAIDILRAGGNAVDAAVGACAVQCVVEAGSTGIGGDCFALISREGSTDIRGYNGSGRTPAAATLDWYRRAGITAIERHSPHAVTVPGAVEAWARLVKDHGRMPLSEILQPAIKLARDGYPITPRVAYDIGNQRDLLRQDPNAAATFLREWRGAGRRHAPVPAGSRGDAGSDRPRGPRRLLSRRDCRRHGRVSEGRGRSAHARGLRGGCRRVCHADQHASSGAEPSTRSRPTVRASSR